MKKTVLSMLAAGLVLASCGSAGNILSAAAAAGANGTTTTTTTTTTTSTSSNHASMLNNLLTGLVSKAVPVTAASMVGTWTYDGPECRFESENFLSQAGGELAAAQVEAKLGESLAKVGITPGACTFTFRADNTCDVIVGGKAIITNGNYTVNSNTRQLNIKSALGLMSMTGQVYLVGNTMTVLYDAQKLLSLVKTVGAVSGNANSVAGTLTTIVNSYKGMQLGMNLKK